MDARGVIILEEIPPRWGTLMKVLIGKALGARYLCKYQGGRRGGIKGMTAPRPIVA